MGCGNCGSGASGAAPGCKGNGGCSSGGCNRLNVYDWLSNLPLHDAAKPYPIVEFSFNKGSRKEFFRNNTHHILEKGACFAVEGLAGFDLGQVSLTGELVKLQLKKYGVKEAEVTKRVLHPATEEEIEMSSKHKEREAEVLIRSRAIARNLKLEMKLCEVEIQADGKKGTFFYTADSRVDFRELIRVYATDFKMKVEMKQIGARQESGKVGGIGSCGRELCCSTWLTDFKSVNTTAARYQNLSINQTKLSGQCGRLKCCLNYELDTYMDALSVFPHHAEHLETVKGVAHLQKKDIFKNLMWYSYSDNNKQYPLTIERVQEIKAMNKQGQKADELHPVELETRESKTGKVADMGYVNDVGQITLKALEKNKKKKHGKSGGQGQQGGGQGKGQQQAKGPGGQQGGGQSGSQQGPRQHKGPHNQPKGQQPNKGPHQPKPASEGDPGSPASQGDSGRQGQHQNQPRQGGQPNQNRGQQHQHKGQQPRPQGGQQGQPRPPRPEGGDAADGQNENKGQQQRHGRHNRPQQGQQPRTPRPEADKEQAG